MDQARHNRAAELFQLAADMPPEIQASFLKAQCAGDPDLQRILEDLLREDRGGPLVIENGLRSPPPVSSLPQDLSGRTLSHYRILRPVASGGMATVYRAIDTRLERTVALKFLPPSVVDEPASRERFLREARAIASIDHPNVCTVYEVEEAEGFIFIAMAYLEGMPLDQRIANGPLPSQDAIDIVVQAARGLEAAHAKGIVHRDIKPGNLMLIDSGSGPLLRILDFGIAQWTEKTVLTQTGLTIGTVSYMAPEQIEQSRVDARADIWSLGVVLYQMLSGRLPFDQGSAREILAAIAGPQPVDLTALSGAPPGLITIVRKMLQKDLARRYQTASAVTRDLENERSNIKAAGDSRKGFRSRMFWGVGLLAASALSAALLAVKWGKPPVDPDPPRVTPFTFYPGHEANPAISPDGSQIAFVGQGKDGSHPMELYVQRIGSTEPRRLTRNLSGFEDRAPAWNPTGTRIAFLRARRGERFARIQTISNLGGTEEGVDVEGVLSSGRLAWSPDGRSLVFTGVNRANQGAIFEVSLEDRAVRQRSFPGDGQADCCPQFDPSGRRLAMKRNEVEIVVTSDGNESPRALPVRASWPGLAWTGDGRSLVYSWFGQLAKVDVSNASIKRLGSMFGPNVSDISIRDRRMAYVRWDFEHSIWKLDIRRTAQGHAPKITGVSKVQLITSTLREDSPHFSPDGEWIAFASERSGSTDIWAGRRDGSELRRLTFLDGQSAGTPRWSPDGKWVAFDVRPPSSKPDIYVVPAAGGAVRRLTSKPGGADVPSWSQDGRWIYFHSRSDDQIWKVPSDGKEISQVTRGGGFECFESVYGVYLYYSKSDGNSGIWRRDSRNGKEEAIPELAQVGQSRHWVLGRSGIFFVPNSEAESKDAAVRYFDFATRRTSRVAVTGKLVTAGPGTLAVSQDETSLLYVPVGRDNRDIMLVENFK